MLEEHKRWKMDVVNLQNVTKAYTMGGKKFYALYDISLRVRKGEFFIIMGPSGSGKSTLMHIIGCLDRPTKGKVIIDGVDTSKVSEKKLAEIRNKRIGFIFQTFNLMPRMSALKNVALPLVFAGISKAEREERAKKMLKKVGLERRMYHMPSELSGGERQRVAIARALINSPSIILADEPTGNLDIATSEEIMNILQSLNKEGKTIIMVTHDSLMAVYGKKIVRMIDGRIA